MDRSSITRENRFPGNQIQPPVAFPSTFPLILRSRTSRCGGQRGSWLCMSSGMAFSPLVLRFLMAAFPLSQSGIGGTAKALSVAKRPMRNAIRISFPAVRKFSGKSVPGKIPELQRPAFTGFPDRACTLQKFFRKRLFYSTARGLKRDSGMVSFRAEHGEQRIAANPCVVVVAHPRNGTHFGYIY